MAAKTANVAVRVEPNIKREAESIIEELGLSVSAVINSLYRQIIYRRGIPYPLTISAAPKSVEEMTQAEFNAMLQIGLEQAKRGEGRPVDEVFEKLLREI